MSSEFGKGFTYCLGLFLCHDERQREYKKMEGEMKRSSMASLWFNAASDHLYELIVPHTIPRAKRREIENWRLQCLQYRLDECEWDDVDKAIQYAKDLLRYWDDLMGIDTEKGSWE